MRVDCQWIATNLEDYFCDRLSTEKDQLARAHLEDCGDCHEQVQRLKDIDPLIKKYFQRELSLARAPRRRRSWLVPVGAAAALASVLVALTILRAPDVADKPQADQLPTASSVRPSEQIPEVDKAQEPSLPVRTKPQTPERNGAQIKAEANLGGDEASDFLVTDPAGYSRTIENYRGYVLLFGVWSSEQPRAAANLERIYKTFGSNTQIRILGVSNQRETKPPDTTFPVVYNQGSRLLGARSGDFVLLDETGSVTLRGSLLDNPESITDVVRAALKRQ